MLEIEPKALFTLEIHNSVNTLKFRFWVWGLFCVFWVVSVRMGVWAGGAVAGDVGELGGFGVSWI